MPPTFTLNNCTFHIDTMYMGTGTETTSNMGAVTTGGGIQIANKEKGPEKTKKCMGD
jgi:hypothetical protein